MPITTLNTAAMARMSRRMSHSQPYCGSSAHSVQTISIATMQTARMTRDLIMLSSFRTLIILPLDHCFAHVVGFYIMIACGATVATVQVGATPMETLKNIPQNIREVRPHFLLSVPALAKNFRKNIEGSIRAKGRFTERLFNLALRTAYLYNKLSLIHI